MSPGAVGTGNVRLLRQQFLKHIAKPTCPSGLECWFIDITDGIMRMTGIRFVSARAGDIPREEEGLDLQDLSGIQNEFMAT